MAIHKNKIKNSLYSFIVTEILYLKPHFNCRLPEHQESKNTEIIDDAELNDKLNKFGTRMTIREYVNVHR